MSQAARQQLPPLDDNFDQLSAPCAKGCAIILDPLAGTVKFVPLTCKSWACPDCSKYLSSKLHDRIQSANPTKFITLTVAHVPGLNPELAEQIIRKQWPRFIQNIRRHRKDFQYLRVLEYQKNGWPHLHLIARCHYLPYPLLRDAWNGKVLQGFVSIKAIDNPAGIGRELTKYIQKSFLLNSLKGTRRHAYTVSKNFFMDSPQSTPDPVQGTALTFCTSAPATEVLAYVTFALGIQAAIDVGPSSFTLAIAAAFKPSAVAELIRYFASLPWWKKSHNQAVARSYAKQSPAGEPP